MTNTTLEYWDVDGVSLNTYAFNAETVGGDRISVPALRGSDLTIPGIAGDRWMPKVADSRTITLGMWVIGMQEDGSKPSNRDNQAQFDTNWRKIRNLLFTPGRQFTLTKRFYVGGVLKTASTLGQYAGGLNPVMNGRARAVFTVDIKLNDPYFYSAPVNVNLTSSPLVITAEGDVVTSKVSLAMAGARVNPKVHNNELNVDVTYQGSLSVGDTLAIDVPTFSSITDPSATAPYNSVGNIRHSGAPQWLLLQPGTNTMVTTATSGTGLITLTYQPAWL